MTVPIERALQSVPSAIGRRSRTIFGLSVVDVTFEYGVDDPTARQAVLEKLRESTLPNDVVPTLAPPTTPAGELYRYVIEGPGRDELELRDLQDWVIAPRLLQVPGVGDVFAFGGLVKQYQIEVDPLALYPIRAVDPADCATRSTPTTQCRRRPGQQRPAGHGRARRRA